MKNRLPKAKPYRRDIFVPAYQGKYACTVHIRLTPEEVPQVQALADKLGMSFEGVVESYVNRRRAMVVRLRSSSTAGGSSIALLPALPPESMVRLQRAAKHYEKSLEAFIAEAIAGQIHGAEDTMLLAPRNGELIGEDFLDALLLRKVDYHTDSNAK